MSSTALKFGDRSVTSSQRLTWPAQLPALLTSCSIFLPCPIGLDAKTDKMPQTASPERLFSCHLYQLWGGLAP